jgi:hypothetical protein
VLEDEYLDSIEPQNYDPYSVSMSTSPLHLAFIQVQLGIRLEEMHGTT